MLDFTKIWRWWKPITNCRPNKSSFSIRAHLNIIESILNAKPTDGLWGDDRTDEDQLGAIMLNWNGL